MCKHKIKAGQLLKFSIPMRVIKRNLDPMANMFNKGEFLVTEVRITYVKGIMFNTTFSFPMMYAPYAEIV